MNLQFSGNIEGSNIGVESLNQINAKRMVLFVVINLFNQF